MQLCTIEPHIPLYTHSTSTSLVYCDVYAYPTDHVDLVGYLAM